ncbi:hypothetical protein ACHHYP_08506 [Achlya hypogyna]|uniref:FYVE-type domain-containing protein n=1 Tax=Achlya hypogyna TaxID=1202772 RepID=A0A1V9YPE6_ACHHY|nr:hypothetical protein ACHHYP_08506 [Achlya hypogyna]
MQFESHKVGGADHRGSDPGPKPPRPAPWQALLHFQRLSPQALGMESVHLCDRSEWAPKGKDVRCACCDKKLLLFGKHNCRVCGDLVCGRCSVKRIKTSQLKSIRTCDKCVQHNLMQFNRRLQQRSSPVGVPPTQSGRGPPRPRAMTSHEVQRPASASMIVPATVTRKLSVHVAPPMPRLASTRSLPRAPAPQGTSWQTKVLLLYGIVLCGVIVFEAPLDVTLLLFAMLALAFGCIARMEYVASTKQEDRLLG